MDFETRIKILTEGAKYDVSCSSSGSPRSAKKGQLGSPALPGCCHSFTADGRCISLLKILMSNRCCYTCKYCVNRAGNDVPRASLSPDELCSLTTDFYRRNYIEGLFLSSAVEKSPDHTMELLLETVIKLRKVYRFNGYIHLKGIPSADYSLLERAARYVDRMSLNVELPSEQSLKTLAPQKSKDGIIIPMRKLSAQHAEENSARHRFLPAGQTTQMIIGATPDRDSNILALSQALYDRFSLKRVYYSAYVPVGDSKLPSVPGSQTREHRLYQADWLLRFYGFHADELLEEGEDLSLDVDPKSMWAIRHPNVFPVEVNRAPFELLLRVPGIGTKSAWRIVNARRHGNLTFEDLIKMRVVMKRARHFLTVRGKFFGFDGNRETLRLLLSAPDAAEESSQISFFDRELQSAVLTGEF